MGLALESGISTRKKFSALESVIIQYISTHTLLINLLSYYQSIFNFYHQNTKYHSLFIINHHLFISYEGLALKIMPKSKVFTSTRKKLSPDEEGDNEYAAYTGHRSPEKISIYYFIYNT